jgi:putative oxidoreductase
MSADGAQLVGGPVSDRAHDLGLKPMTPYDTSYSVGLLILRLVLGVTLAAHGYNKFFGGGRIPGTARWFESIGMKPGKFHATVAATTEMAAGLGLAAGFLTPIPAAGFVSLMLVAAWTVHRANGFFIVKEGWEYNLVLAVSAVAVATLGAGKLSLDYVVFGKSWMDGWQGLLISVVLGLAGAIGQLAIFYRPPAKQAG